MGDLHHFMQCAVMGWINMSWWDSLRVSLLGAASFILGCMYRNLQCTYVSYYNRYYYDYYAWCMHPICYLHSTTWRCCNSLHIHYHHFKHPWQEKIRLRWHILILPKHMNNRGDIIWNKNREALFTFRGYKVERYVNDAGWMPLYARQHVTPMQSPSTGYTLYYNRA